MSGSFLPTLAWRNIWRNRRRTVITLSSIVFGILLAVVFTGIGDSTYSKMIDLSARLGGGHVTLQHPDYLEMPALKRSILKIQEKRAAIEGDPRVERVVNRIVGTAMLATAQNSTGASLIGIDPKAENKQTLSVIDALAEGTMFASRHDKGIILGEKLAKNLGLRLGRKLVYTLTNKQGDIVSGLARLRGILRTGSPSVDAGLCLMPIDTLRKTIGFAPDESTQVAVFLKDHRQSDELAAELRRKIATAVVTWDQSKPELAGFIKMKVSGTFVFEILIAILVAAGIFNTLFVSVMERMREFGIMMALGYGPRRLFGLVMWESFWIALIGLLAGVLITLYPYYYLSTTGIDLTAMMPKGNTEVAGVGIDPVLHARIFVESAVIIGAAVFIATLTSGLYPAWRAGRVVPVDSIKLV